MVFSSWVWPMANDLPLNFQSFSSLDQSGFCSTDHLLPLSPTSLHLVFVIVVILYCYTLSSIDLWKMISCSLLNSMTLPRKIDYPSFSEEGFNRHQSWFWSLFLRKINHPWFHQWSFFLLDWPRWWSLSCIECLCVADGANSYFAWALGYRKWQNWKHTPESRL